MKMNKIPLIALSIILAGACTSKTATQGDNDATTETVSEADFLKTQPLESGLYDADYYDIAGTNARRGHFDGRVYFSLSPELSAFYVFENGNRTKIDYLVSLAHPFEKGDSGIYKSTDAKGFPVTINTDSTVYMLSFQKNGADVQIGFNPKARHTGSAVEMLEKINETKQKNK